MPPAKPGVYFAEMPPAQRKIYDLISNFGLVELWHRNFDSLDFPQFSTNGNFVTSEVPKELYEKFEKIVQWEEITSRPLKVKRGMHRMALNKLFVSEYRMWTKRGLVELSSVLGGIFAAKSKFHATLKMDLKNVEWEYRCMKIAKEFDSEEMNNPERRQNAHEFMRKAFKAKLKVDEDSYEYESFSSDCRNYFDTHKEYSDTWLQETKNAMNEMKSTSDFCHRMVNSAYRKVCEMAIKDFGDMKIWYLTMVKKNQHLDPADVRRHEVTREEYNVEFFDDKIKEFDVNMKYLERLQEMALEMGAVIDNAINNMSVSDYFSEEQIQRYRQNQAILE